VLVEDILAELVETRRAADENAKSNDGMCDEIARCHGWLLHFNENGMVCDEAQMAVDGADSPQCSPRRSTADDVPPLVERVNRELCGQCFASGYDAKETCPDDDKCSEWYKCCGLLPPDKSTGKDAKQPSHEGPCEEVNIGLQESPDQIRARMLASNIPAEVRNASLQPTRAELDAAGIAGLRDQARRWRMFLEMMRHTFDSVGPRNEEGWRCAGHIVAAMVDAALKGEEP
jgi:hypothetical protein